MRDLVAVQDFFTGPALGVAGGLVSAGLSLGLDGRWRWAAWAATLLLLAASALLMGRPFGSRRHAAAAQVQAYLASRRTFADALPPVWSRHIESSRVQMETAVSELSQRFGQIVDQLQRTLQQSGSNGTSAQSRALMSPIRVMVVDDSAVVRQVLTGLFNATPDLQVMHAVADPLLAIQRLKDGWPDVIVLDVEMPRMDGITFLRKIMQEHPTPVVICSSLTERGAKTTIDAMAAGAVSIVTKPQIGLKQFLQETAEQLVSTVRSAAKANVRRTVAVPPAPPRYAADAVLPPGAARAMARTTERIVAIGTSTGGTQALEVVLTALPRVSSGIVIVQHMPEKFTATFAARLDGLCRITVKEAANNDRVLAGQALIAPGGRHMVLKRSGAQYFVEVLDGPLVNRHRPSVDVLFRSVARSAGANALGIIMTGMGDDGAAGMLEMRTAGARTIAQDEESCVVFGMPREAMRRGSVERTIALSQISAEVSRHGIS